MKDNADDILKSRFWVRENFEWLINEVIFHREMKQFFSNKKLVVWNFYTSEGKVKLYETTE